ADQEPGERGGAPAIPRRLCTADLGARPHRARPEPPTRQGRRLGVLGAGLGRAQVGRHRARARDRAPARLPPGLARGDRAGAARGARARGVIWEIFRQEREGQPFQHGGSLEAPNLVFAETYAREFYGRRDESLALWIVPREPVVEVGDPYLTDVFDRDDRRVDGYSLKVKLKEARERAGTSPSGCRRARPRLAQLRV